MKLKDKIECTLERHVKLKQNQSENIEKIADEFAIGFAEWMSKKENLMHLIKIGYTTKELLEIYKKEKGL